MKGVSFAIDGQDIKVKKMAGSTVIFTSLDGREFKVSRKWFNEHAKRTDNNIKFITKDAEIIKSKTKQVADAWNSKNAFNVKDAGSNIAKGDMVRYSDDPKSKGKVATNPKKNFRGVEIVAVSWWNTGNFSESVPVSKLIKI